MTCIVGYIDKNKDIYIGGDSAGTDVCFNSRIRKDKKVFIIDNQIIIGCTGSFRMCQLLQFKLFNYLKQEINNAKENKYMPETYEFMCTIFIDAVRNCLKEGGYTTIKDNEEIIGQFLVGFNGRLFSVGSDLQVGEDIENYNALGCGANYALGALNVLVDNAMYLPKNIVNMALETAEKFSAACKRPNIILKLKYKTGTKQ